MMHVVVAYFVKPISKSIALFLDALSAQARCDNDEEKRRRERHLFKGSTIVSNSSDHEQAAMQRITVVLSRHLDPTCSPTGAEQEVVDAPPFSVIHYDVAASSLPPMVAQPLGTKGSFILSRIPNLTWVNRSAWPKRPFVFLPERRNQASAYF